MKKKFFFPVVHPPRKQGAGYAEVFVWSDRTMSLSSESHFPHQRFFLDRVIRAWEMLEQPCLWPDAVLGWSPHSVDEETCPPQQWQGPSANLTTLLAVAHHCQPFHPKRLQTHHIWATGCLSAQGTLEAANQFATKAQFFLEHGKQTGVHGIFIAPLEHQPVLAHPQQHGLAHIPYRVQIFDPQIKAICTQEAPVFLLLPQQSTSVAQFLRWARGDSARTKRVLYASAGVFCCCLLFAWLWSHPFMFAKMLGTQKADISSYPQHSHAPNNRLSLSNVKNASVLGNVSSSRSEHPNISSNPSAPVVSSQPRTSLPSVLAKAPNQQTPPLYRTKGSNSRKQQKQQRHLSPRKRLRAKIRSTKHPSSEESSKLPKHLALGTSLSSTVPHRMQTITPGKQTVVSPCLIQLKVSPITAEVQVEPNDSFTKPDTGVFCFFAKTQSIVIKSQGMRDCVIDLSQTPSSSSSRSIRRYQAVLQPDSPYQPNTVLSDYCIRSQPLVRK